MIRERSKVASLSRRTALIGAALGLALALEACGGGSGAPTRSSGAKPTGPFRWKLVSHESPGYSSVVCGEFGMCFIQSQSSRMPGVLPGPRFPSQTVGYRVSCGSPDNCVAVDSEGEAAIFDGKGWSGSTQALAIYSFSGACASSPNTGCVPTVSCPTRSWCVAALNDGNNAVWSNRQWNGQALIGASPFYTDETLKAPIGCWAAGSCYTSDGQFVYKLERSAWSQANVGVPFAGSSSNPTDYVQQIVCTSKPLCMLADNQGEVSIAGPHGSIAPQQQLYSSPPDPAGYVNSPAIACSGTDNCFALGADGSFHRWTGSKWITDKAKISSQIPGGASFDVALSCASASSCIAVLTPDSRASETISGQYVFSGSR